jgi:hypothetical protein
MKSYSKRQPIAKGWSKCRKKEITTKKGKCLVWRGSSWNEDGTTTAVSILTDLQGKPFVKEDEKGKYVTVDLALFQRD